ncbi:MAG TPA: recombinase [Firmicutes bacterium]|nr:recombinase [Bacillota bacterium]
MENKINYHKEALKIIEGLKGRKPRLLAHVCCGPCSTYPLKFLHDHFDVTVIFHNSNIYPEREYVRRYQVLEEFVSRFNIDFSADVKIVKTAYENDEFNKHLAPFGDEPEGGARCLVCYRKRMDESMKYAEENGYEFFTTVMTISPHKDSQAINKIGQGLSKKYPKVKYFHSDFKKSDGFLEAGKMCQKYCLYRQAYCGCRYSYEAMLKRPPTSNK